MMINHREIPRKNQLLDEVEETMKTVRTSKVTLFVLTLIVVAVFFIVPVYFIYSNVRLMAIDNLGQSAMHYAQTVARMIEHDIEPYRDLYEVADDENPAYDIVYYERMLGEFQNIVEDLEATFVYTTKVLSETEFVYLLDGENPVSDVFSPFGSTDTTTAIEWQVFSTGVAGYTHLQTFEKWGTFLSGYAPIVDSSTGEILGLVGVDYSAAHVQSLLDALAWTMVIGVSLLTIFASFAFYKVLDLRFIALETDYLTGLSSKRSYERFLELATAEAIKSKKPLSMMMIDVDDFKQINDVFGHEFGDNVLKFVAKTLLQFRQKGESIGRYGGDEFVYVLPSTTAVDAAQRAEEIQIAIQTHDLKPDNKRIKLTLSIGVAAIADIEEPDKLMIAADRAMYLSKNTGKNKTTIYIE
jgi:diguanylate cyclase (GGDEF)-like protein